MDREDILKKAEEMFFLIGFKTVTMDDIANGLAISKRTLYEHFGSKEKLIEEVLDKGFREVQEYLVELQGKELNAVEELLSLERYIDENFNSRQSQNCLFQLYKYYAQLYQKTFMKQKRKVIEGIRDNFLKGKREGLYRESIEPEFYAVLFIQVQNILETNIDFFEDIDNKIKVGKTHSDIFIRGILSTKGVEEYEKIIDRQ